MLIRQFLEDHAVETVKLTVIDPFTRLELEIPSSQLKVTHRSQLKYRLDRESRYAELKNMQWEFIINDGEIDGIEGSDGESNVYLENIFLP